jgi:hypothetical protein
VTDKEIIEEYLQDESKYLIEDCEGNLINITKKVRETCLAMLEASRSRWHYVKDELPEISGRYFVYTGGEPFILDYDTECSSFGYWTVLFGDNWGVRDEVFETVKDREEDEVIAWQYLPDKPEEVSK